MRITELAPVPVADLPLAELADQLRLGRGFADGALQEALLASHLQAALAAIETRIGKILIARPFELELAYWRDPAQVPLPLAPVSEISAVSVQGESGPVVELAASRWRLEPDPQRPRLVARGRLSLPAVPEGGRAVLRLVAGFGPWGAVPADLRQAVLLLAAQFYEFRHEGAAAPAAALPFGVAALIEPWRAVRVLGGGR